MRIMIRQLAPGMVQQMQSVCTDCSGEGNSFYIAKSLLPKQTMYNQKKETPLSERFRNDCRPVQVR